MTNKEYVSDKFLAGSACAVKVVKLPDLSLSSMRMPAETKSMTDLLKLSC